MSNTNVPRVFQMRGTCNTYSWGKSGKDSLAARLCEKTPGISFDIKDDEHYSEMWYGDYPDFPGKKLDTGETLGSVLSKNKENLLGDYVTKHMNAQLPFLPKILSIAKALPLQIHPDEELAAKLHREQPDNYTDPNHKPEIAVALSKFEVFAGWKPMKIIAALFTGIPGLHRFVPAETNQWTNDTIRSIVINMLLADDETVKTVEQDLAKQNKENLNKLGDQEYILDLLPRLQQQYSARDPGSLVALLCMNYLVLAPGEALFIPADGIHAYVSGDIVECMARSNNVLNAGFCPRPSRENIRLFAKTLTFSSYTQVDDVRLPAKPYKYCSNNHVAIYQPPISEFDMLRIEMGANQSEIIESQNGPAVAIVTNGEGKLITKEGNVKLCKGFIFYISPGLTTEWFTKLGLQVYAAVVRGGSREIR